jgi:hypothetical protein
MHRVSKLAYDDMMKRSTRNPSKCPIFGCKAYWNLDSGSVDKDFQRTMDRFFRVKGAASQRNTANVIDADYTSV